MTTSEEATTAAARDQFIPVRKTDILEALIDHGDLSDAADRAEFRQVCRLLAAIYHYEYFEHLEKLRDLYFHFNPDLGPNGRADTTALDRAYGEFDSEFTAVLTRANFVEVSREEIERSHRESVLVQVKIRADLDGFRDVRFFRRGHHMENFEIKRWYGLHSETIEALVYDDVVLYAAAKLTQQNTAKKGRKSQARPIRPGCVLIKYFRNIASADLNALYPNARVLMSTFDKLVLGLPAIAGGIPIILKLISTFAVLFAVAGFYLGFVATIKDDDLAGALAATTGVVALGGFMMRQWIKYQRQTLKHQKELTDNIYFRNVNNNSGIFDYIIGAAEEQECKEAFLAYYFLRTAAEPPAKAALERSIEAWLQKAFGIDIEFEIADALAKLERLGLLLRDGERLSAPPPAETLARLDAIWDNYFQFNGAPAARASA